MEALKYSKELHSPIDLIIYSLFTSIDNTINLNITPNYVTILRFSLFILAFLNYQYNYTNDNNLNILILSLSYLVNIILDYFDGYIARKYDKVTVLGDILDHLFDILGVIIMLYCIKDKTIVDNIFIIIHLYFLLGKFGYEQKIYNDSDNINETLDVLKLLVIENRFFDYIYRNMSVFLFGLHLVILFIYKNYE